MYLAYYEVSDSILDYCSTQNIDITLTTLFVNNATGRRRKHHWRKM